VGEELYVWLREGTQLAGLPARASQLAAPDVNQALASANATLLITGTADDATAAAAAGRGAVLVSPTDSQAAMHAKIVHEIVRRVCEPFHTLSTCLQI
jgi:hypothetical protein